MPSVGGGAGTVCECSAAPRDAGGVGDPTGVNARFGVGGPMTDLAAIIRSDDVGGSNARGGVGGAWRFGLVVALGAAGMRWLEGAGACGGGAVLDGGGLRGSGSGATRVNSPGPGPGRGGAGAVWATPDDGSGANGSVKPDRDGGRSVPLGAEPPPPELPDFAPDGVEGMDSSEDRIAKPPC